MIRCKINCHRSTKLNGFKILYFSDSKSITSFCRHYSIYNKPFITKIHRPCPYIKFYSVFNDRYNNINAFSLRKQKYSNYILTIKGVSINV